MYYNVCLSVIFHQNLLKSTGAQGKTTVFLITDTQIKEESFLEDIDNLLNTGEVPNLFATDEKAEIMEVRVRMVVAIYRPFGVCQGQQEICSLGHSHMCTCTCMHVCMHMHAYSV